MKKFELTSEFVKNALGTKVFRIKALVKFGDVSAGELGGYVEKEENLAQDGNAWVYGDAWVYGNAKAVSYTHLHERRNDLGTVSTMHPVKLKYQ